jgi:hypothetical protein
MDKLTIVLIIIIASCLICIGWFSNEYFINVKYHRELNGLRFVDNNSHIAAIERAQTYEPYGDWVCINVRNMDYTVALQTCQHEVGHEIFATACQNNFTKCLEAVK